MEAKAGTDERFYTPRSSARRGYSSASASSEDERFVSPRESARSVSSDDNEYVTPRETAPIVAHAPRSASISAAALSSTAVYKDAAFRASSKHIPVVEPTYDAIDYKQHRSGSVSELRSAAPPADDYDLFSAARHNRYDSVVYMLDQGVPVNSRDSFGNTLLSIACQNGLKRIAKLALRRGANINSQNNRGNTALHFCFAYGYGDSLGAYLISKGADTTIENDDGIVCYYGIAQNTARK
ncbi:hypothetical protein PF005_g21875 [Phytophthora fragariae]|uniref:Uncharacterized protein n=2 Tax=Phytophthora TaxID=4783 RepID=A0A6A3EFW8_9STRA|nr:hypothetical protein PF003_g15906 [Phytophthora fragariae]KAE9287245.1 hypothetical protein PR003_g26099 [Phytophthora rubi]KAE8930791.1 hypothetical protein PF009_g19132 [Phytophthora fragariae]KAE8980591.1 hypothetical protein PF011_g22376 [Phytophthora fragariae]KAE9083497.1 hypothetical protein PF007_g21878 [Phytophthora fragariae]